MVRPLIPAHVPGPRENGINGYLRTVSDAGSPASAMQRLAELPLAQRVGWAKRRDGRFRRSLTRSS